MPKMDKYEAIKHVRELCSKIPVIAQTAYAMANVKEKVMNAGFDDYITKPITAQLLAEKMDHLLHVKLRAYVFSHPDPFFQTHRSAPVICCFDFADSPGSVSKLEIPSECYFAEEMVI